MGALLPILILVALPATYIERIYDLRELVDASTQVMEGTIESADPARRGAVLRGVETFKGDAPAESLTINLNTGRVGHAQEVVRHLVPGARVVVFSGAGNHPQIQTALVYVNRFFFQIWRRGGNPKAAWLFTQFEPRMNRTFAGPPNELCRILRGRVTGKGQAPPPDPDRPPLTLGDMAKRPPPDGTGEWTDKGTKLRRLLGKRLEDGNRPVFKLEPGEIQVTVVKLDAAGTLHLSRKEETLTPAWSDLGRENLRRLAAALAPEGRELSAWFDRAVAEE